MITGMVKIMINSKHLTLDELIAKCDLTVPAPDVCMEMNILAKIAKRSHLKATIDSRLKTATLDLGSGIHIVRSTFNEIALHLCRGRVGQK